MQPYITLELIKQQCNIDEWSDVDDAYLENLCLVCQEVTEQYLGYSLAEILNENGLLPKPIEHAILLLIGHYYAHRESVSELTYKEVPQTFEFLIQMFKNYRYNH